MDKILILLIITISNIMLINGQCKWTADGTSTSIDLSCLAGQTITASDGQGYNYKFSVCSNDQTCTRGSDGGGDAGSTMVSQTIDTNDYCWFLGQYSSSVTPIITDQSDANGGAFLFTYNSGSESGSCSSEYNNLRTWKPQFICKTGVEWEVPNQVSEEADCVYDIDIYTKYACISAQQSCSLGDDSSGLSGGWIFIIILISGFFAYFCIGYIVMALTINKAGGFGDVSNNIPNKKLWTNCIPLTIAGCSVTKEYIMGLMNKDKTNDKEDTLTDE